MKEKLKQFAAILQDDPAVAHVAGFTGGRQTNGPRVQQAAWAAIAFEP